MKIRVENLISEKVLRAIRIILVLVILNSIVNRCVYSWNEDVPALLYFTIQSNIMCGLYWLWSAFFPKKRNEYVSLAVTTYIGITGIVFLVFLNYGFVDTIYTKLWQNEITSIVHYYSMIGSIIAHYMIPFLAVADFLIFTDARKLKLTKNVMMYPVVYCVFAITFTAISGKYIYPFYNPDIVGGWWMVALICVVIFVIIYFMNRCLISLNRMTQNKIDLYYKKLFSE